MEENKKRPLSEEELEQVAGGVRESTTREGWYCVYCKENFLDLKEALEHENNCPKKASRDDNLGGGLQRLLKPVIF